MAESPTIEGLVLLYIMFNQPETRDLNKQKEIISSVVKEMLDTVISSIEEKERYNLDADDSSDEEDDLEENDFDTSKFESGNQDNSFKAHCLGRYVLFSKLVRTKYHQKKKNRLNGNIIPIQNKVIRRYIHNLIEHTLRQILPSFLEKPLTEKLMDDFIKTQLPSMAKYLITHKHALLRQGNRTKIHPKIAILLKRINKYILSLPENTLFQLHQFEKGRDFLVDWLSSYNINNYFYDRSMNSINKVITSLQQYNDQKSKKEKFISSSGNVLLGKVDLNLLLNEFINGTQLLEKITAQIIIASGGNKTRFKLFDIDQNNNWTLRIIPQYKDRYRSVWCHYLLEQELLLGNASVVTAIDKIQHDGLSIRYYAIKSGITKQALLKSKIGEIYRSDPTQVERFLPPTNRENYLKESQTHTTNISTVFLKQIKVQLKKSKIELERKTLGGQYTFTADNICDLLANMHLSNRSQRRSIRNVLEEETKPLNALVNNRAWKFGSENEVAVESQSISNGGKRSDLALNMGSYEAVLKQINVLKCQLEVGDYDIAVWIRKTLNGKNLKVLPKHEKGQFPLIIENNLYLKASQRRKVVALTHLFFIVESTRNPGSLIIHQMILDLIIMGKLNWKEALTDKQEMPMALKGAVKGGRTLNREYNQDKQMKTKYCYDYDGDTNNSKAEIVREKENKIVEKWLLHHKNKKISDHIKTRWYQPLFKDENDVSQINSTKNGFSK